MTGFRLQYVYLKTLVIPFKVLLNKGMDGDEKMWVRWFVLCYADRMTIIINIMIHVAPRF